MKRSSFSVALSAIACALAVIFMALGINVPFLIATGYIFGAIFLMLPLAKGLRLGSFLAYVATCLLCLLFGGIAQFYKLFPFIVFFGLHPLVNSLQEKFGVNRWVALLVKDAWFVGAMCASWALFCAMAGIGPDALPFDWMFDWAYLLICIGGAVLFVFYDWLMRRCQRLVDYAVSRIAGGKGGKKGSGKKNSAPPPAEDADVFGEFSPQGERGEDKDRPGGEDRKGG